MALALPARGTARRGWHRAGGGGRRNKTAPGIGNDAWPGPEPELRSALQRPDPLRRRPFRALLHLELYRLTLAQRAKAIHLDFRLVTEKVLASIIGRDEAITLGIVEPLHFTVHCVPSLL